MSGPGGGRCPGGGAGERTGTGLGRRALGEAAPGRRAVALRALGLGDLLTAVPALRALRRPLGPGWRIELLAPATLAPLVELIGAQLTLVDTAPFRLGPLDHVAAGPALAVNLHGRGPQSTARLAALRPGRLVAFGVDAPWRDDEHETERWCRLLRASGLAPDADPGDLRLAPPAGTVDGGGAVVVHPGAASGARRWPAERFAAVARALVDDGHHVVVTGGPTEVGLAREVATLAGLPASSARAGDTSLLELARLVARARLVVCGDTGVAHLATAFGTASVVLFGPTPPTWWGPPAGEPRHRVLWAGQPGDPHGADVHPGLLAIGVDDVLAAAYDVLALHPAG